MLNKIWEYGKQAEVFQEPGFTTKTVRWAIECNENGNFLGVVPLGEKKGIPFSGVPNLSLGELIKGGETRSHFLVDSLSTMLEWHTEKDDAKKKEAIHKKHEYFKSMLLDASKELAILEAAWRLLEDSEQKIKIQEQLQQQVPKPKPADVAVIRINGQNPLETQAWHPWWKNYRKALQEVGKSKSEQVKLSLLTGEKIVSASTHPKIKGTSSVGGLPTGDVLIGFNKEAFESFRLKQSANASMSEFDAKQYTDALNHLLANQTFRFGNTLCVYWYSHKIPEEQNTLHFLEQGEETVSFAEEHAPKRILKQLRQGQQMDVLKSRYYSLILSGNSGRVVVRAWEETDFEQFIKNVVDWFDDLSIVHRREERLAPYPKFMAVVGATARDLKDAPAPMIVELWQAATLGKKIPHSAFAKAFLRIKNAIMNDDPIQHASIGLLKAYHLRNRKDNDMKPYLNPEHPSPAYHCGRLLAVLAKLQRRALGDVGAGVVQRYYGATSQTPALTIGRLMSNAKNHLNKIDSPGLVDWYEQQIASIMGAMQDQIPATLTLEEQSLFALGYYQQLARPAKEEKTTEDQEQSNSNPTHSS